MNFKHIFNMVIWKKPWISGELIKKHQKYTSYILRTDSNLILLYFLPASKVPKENCKGIVKKKP